MNDERYTSTHRIAPPKPTRGEWLWTIRVNHVTWSCELRGHGEYGWEVQRSRDSEFFAGRRFELHAMAVQWAELEQEDLELHV